MSFKEDLNQFYALLRKERLVFIRYPARAFTTIVLPFFIILIFGFTTLLFTDLSNPEVVKSVVTGIFIGMIIYVLLNASSDSSYTIMEEQQQGTLESLYLSPMKYKYLNIFASIVIRYSVIVTTLIIYYILVRLIFGSLYLNHIILALFILLMIINQTIGIAFMMSTWSLKYKETSLRLGWMLPFLFLILCGIFVNITIFPIPIRIISYLIPLTYSVDLLRLTLSSSGMITGTLIPFIPELLITIAGGILFPFLTAIYYKNAEAEMRKTGKLMEY